MKNVDKVAMINIKMREFDKCNSFLVYSSFTICSFLRFVNKIMRKIPSVLPVLWWRGGWGGGDQLPRQCPPPLTGPDLALL